MAPAKIFYLISSLAQGGAENGTCSIWRAGSILTATSATSAC